MKIDGYKKIDFKTWRNCKSETLHIIKQNIEKNGCITKEVLYFVKLRESEK